MIPLAKDTREAIGAFAENVENRGLLFEKMVLSKSWGHEDRFNDANRFNVLRAVSNGPDLLQDDRQEAERKVRSDRTREDVKRQNAYKAKVAGALASVKVDSPEHVRRQAENANQLLRLLEKSYDQRSRTFVAALGGRLLINLAGGVMENAGMALDRCFGLPHIPGSAAKGVARSAALWEIRRTSDRDTKLAKLRLALLAFGFIQKDIGRTGDFTWAAGEDASLVREAADPWAEKSAFQGMVAFLPAYPAETDTLKLVAEVQTPHPRAGQSGDPRPLFFPAVEKNSTFGFAVVMHRTLDDVEPEEILDAASGWLRDAITGDGMGAKTSSGFGWFVIDPKAEEKRREEMEAAAKREEEARKEAELEADQRRAEEKRLAALPEHERRAAELLKSELANDNGIAEFAKNLPEKDPLDQQAFCQLLTTKLKAKWKDWNKPKAKKWKDRVGPIREIAKSHGIELP
ncbi:MAG: type III-B CRISPR module RAMP protein Cmr6 [Verrucomicrobiales bacterium]